MLKRVSALCALSLALGALLLQAQDVFVLPGAGSNTGLVAAYTASPLSQISTFNSGPGSYILLPTIDATKFYVIAKSNSQTITSTLSSFAASVAVANLPVAPSAALITPDGRVLAVAAGNLYLFNTTTDTQILSGGFSQGVGISTFDVAASLDATALYVLGTSGVSGTSQLTALNLATNAASVNVTLPQVATAVSVGPNGLVYVSLPDEILELDPRTLKPTAAGTIAVTGTPGPFVFTPDGQYAVALNQASAANSTIIIVTLATHTARTPNLGLAELSSLQVSGIDTVTGFSGESLYQITITNSTSITPLPIPGSGVLALAASNEVPAGANTTVQNLYAATATNLYRITPATNGIASQYPLNNLSVGALAYAAPTQAAAQSRVGSLVTYGTNQTILPGGVSEPLVVQVLDSNNHPINGEAVQFVSSSNGAILSSNSAVTQANGYALTYLTAPATAGQITVNAVVGSFTANFNIDVSSTAGGASNPKLSILAGQGQLLGTNTNTALGPSFGSPLEVLVTDSNGNPLANIPVTFTVPPNNGWSVLTNGGGGTTATVNTNANGTAEVNVLTSSLSPNNENDFLQLMITATTPITNSVVFYITSANSYTVHFLAPTAGATLTGPAGSILPAAVTAVVYSPNNVPIPNVSLTLNDGNANPSLFPSVSCNGGIVLTNTNGAVSCDILFGPHIGSGTFTAVAGYIYSSFSNQFVVTAGTAAVVQITQGNNQAGNPGQQLPLALVIHVTDAGGNAVVGAKVNWQVVTAGTVTLSNVATVTDGNGNASALATLGSVGGAAQVTATVGAFSATFNLAVNIPSAGIQKISGDQQTAPLNTAFQSPLTVEVVNSAGAPVPGVQVNFQVTSGVATLGFPSVTTGTNGQASTTVTAGGTGGTITVSATSGTFIVTFTLTATLPGLSNVTVVNGASFQKGTGISPGGIATISATGDLAGVQGLVTANNIVGPLPTTLAGVSVTFGVAATPAPIYYVQSINGADQITVQVPFEVVPGSAVPLTVSVANGGSTTVNVTVKPFAPGVFSTIYNGKSYPVVQRPDGSFVSPTNPAQLGEDITVYVTGLGQVTPATATGDAGIPGQSVALGANGALPLIVGLNNSGVPLISAEYAPGLVGVYVITLQVPLNTKTGPSQPLGIVMYDSAHKAYFADSTYLPIQ